MKRNSQNENSKEEPLKSCAICWIIICYVIRTLDNILVVDSVAQIYHDIKTVEEGSTVENIQLYTPNTVHAKY